MAFLDFLKDVALNATHEMEKKIETIQKYKSRYEFLDDRELIRKYKTTSGLERAACVSLLKERGYGSSNE